MAEDSILNRVGVALGIAKAAAIPTGTLGSSRLTSSDAAGQIVTLGDRELNLVGDRRYDSYDDMVKDVSIIAAGVRLLLNLIANAIWTVNPPEDLDEGQKAQAQEYADFMYDQLFGMTTSWSAVVRKVAMFKFIGFTIMEWTAERTEDGQIGLKDIEHRPQRTIIRWVRDGGGTVEAVVQRVNGRSEVILPRSKIIYAVDDTLTDHPEGMGLFRHLAPTVERLKQFLDLEEVGFSTDLRGIPIAKAPLGELQEQVEAAGVKGSEGRKVAEARRQALLRPMFDFLGKHVRNKKSGALVASDTFASTAIDKTKTPSSVSKWSFELLNGDSTSFADMANAINRLTQELARVLSVEHLMLGADGTGSLALAKSKIGTLHQTATGTLYDLLEVFDRDIVAPVAELNGWPEELWPQMGVNEISDRDVEAIAEVLAKMAQAGSVLMPDDPAIGEVRDLIGLSRPPEDGMAMDATLNPARNAPVDPDAEIEGNPEDDQITKRRVLKSRSKRRNRKGR